MRKFVLILAAFLMVASFAIAEDAPTLKVSGNTSTYVYHDDSTVGAFDLDSNVTLAYAIFSLALNAGYTLTFPDTNVISWGYLFSYAQTFGPLGVYASIGSDSMNVTLGGAFAGSLLDDIKIGADLTKAPFAVNAYSLFSAYDAYNFFQGFEISAAYLPKWGSVRAGINLMDAQAVTDGVGYVNAPAAVEGFSFYLKATVNY